MADKLLLLWSPEQIPGWLMHTYPCDESQYVSHETIHRSLFLQARGVEAGASKHLRRTRGMRRSCHYTQKTAIHVTFQRVSAGEAWKIRSPGRWISVEPMLFGPSMAASKRVRSAVRVKHIRRAAAAACTRFEHFNDDFSSFGRVGCAKRRDLGITSRK